MAHDQSTLKHTNIPGRARRPAHQPSTAHSASHRRQSMNTQSAVPTEHACNVWCRGGAAGGVPVCRAHRTGVRGHCERRRSPCAAAMRADPPSPLALIDALDGVVSGVIGPLAARHAVGAPPTAHVVHGAAQDRTCGAQGARKHHRGALTQHVGVPRGSPSQSGLARSRQPQGRRAAARWCATRVEGRPPR